MQNDPMQPSFEARRRHWRKTLRITGMLLAIWFVVTFVVGYFARDLGFSLFGWPFSFWVGAQGALVVYVLLIGYYAWAMDRLDQQLHRGDESEPAQAPSRRARLMR
ncbi:DUF4212 domain-containing protein [Tepidimonas aquatica]|uniref:Putative solute:sodium symporter small subunit n=1 Tax=Tepidimonas aquatica TaxID=247482 RepID=A0A554WDU5_9BURK|nr:DUF4212 domain-containing protein [Tepidimonas aquatica]TSE21736.1 putative solute:sodium symporter small subunit [Tepidimonas aquatica]